MATSTRRRALENLRDRVSTPDSMYCYCRVIGCHQPATAGTNTGLNRLYCRKHEEHYERHGSYTKPSYRLSEIQEHRKLAIRWLDEHKDNPSVRYALNQVAKLYRRAGPKIEAFRLRGLKPEERAWAAWARLREANVDPMRPLVAWLTIALAIKNDPIPERKKEYQLVQAAKLIHRMASGSHRRWPQSTLEGEIQTKELHVYPKSRGLVLRHLGKQLEQASGGFDSLAIEE